MTMCKSLFQTREINKTCEGSLQSLNSDWKNLRDQIVKRSMEKGNNSFKPLSITKLPKFLSAWDPPWVPQTRVFEALLSFHSRAAWNPLSGPVIAATTLRLSNLEVAIRITASGGRSSGFAALHRKELPVSSPVCGVSYPPNIPITI